MENAILIMQLCACIKSSPAEAFHKRKGATTALQVITSLASL